MLSLADFEVVRRDRQVVFPVGVPLLADLLNRYVGHLPVVDWLSLMFGIVARPSPEPNRRGRVQEPSTSVIIPCRNESGHIRPLVDDACPASDPTASSSSSKAAPPTTPRRSSSRSSRSSRTCPCAS